MASSTTGSNSLVYTRRAVPVPVAAAPKYCWPDDQLNFWTLIMTVAACTVIGVFATLTDVQQRLGLFVPWYFPYFITVASLTLLYIGILRWLMIQRRLLPAVVLLGAFMFFVLWMVGLIVVSIELWGPMGSVSSNCNLKVFSKTPAPANTESNLAWLAHRGICQEWQAVFALAVVSTAFLLWIMVMAIQVFYTQA